MKNLEAGTVVDGRFEITGELGRGGFATVYSAVQSNIKRPVAIKVLRTQGLGDLAENFRARFKREAESAGRIHHPGIVKIHDFGLMDDKTPFVVMELLRGQDLEAELNENGALEPKRALRLFMGCLDAVQAGHALGIVHKDLKPANLFLADPDTLSESLRVTDFGIAAIADERTERLTAQGLQVGSPGYMAPEYLMEGVVTPAIDVYQMGLILVEMLSGTPVVDDPSDLACMKMHARGQLPLPVKYLDSPLGPVLTGALARDVDKRFQSAGAFLNALKTVDPEDIPPVGPHDVRTLLCGTQPLSAAVEGADVPDWTQAETQAGDRVVLGLAPTVINSFEAPEILTEPTPEPEAKAPRLWFLAAAAALLLVVGIVGLIWMATSKPDPTPATAGLTKPDEPASPARPAPAALATPATPVAAAAPSAATPAVATPKSAPVAPSVVPAVVKAVDNAKVSVTIHVKPPTARIHQGKTALGRGEATLEFADTKAAPVELRLKAAGYKTRTVTLAPADAPTVKIELKRAPKATGGTGFLE